MLRSATFAQLSRFRATEQFSINQSISINLNTVVFAMERNFRATLADFGLTFLR